MILSIIAIIISSIAVIISGLTFYYHFLLKAKITLEFSNDENKPYIVEGKIDGVQYKWIRIKTFCSNKIFNVSARNLHLKMLNVERWNEVENKWNNLNPINLFYLRWVINDGIDKSFIFRGDLTWNEPQYFNLATLFDDNNKQLLCPGIPGQGNVIGWKPDQWFKEGCFRYTVGIYGDNVIIPRHKTHDYKICINFGNNGKVSFCSEVK